MTLQRIYNHDDYSSSCILFADYVTVSSGRVNIACLDFVEEYIDGYLLSP